VAVLRSLRGALHPGGGCLKQIDPAFPLPLHGIVKQVRPWLQYERHAFFGDRDADLEGMDRFDNAERF